MKRKSIALVTALVLTVSLVACSTNKTDNTKQTETQTERTETVILTDYVSGLKDWTVEVNAKNVNFMDGISYDKEVVKEVTSDDSKVDLTKEGKYNLVYSVVPQDDSISKETVIKTVTVNVVSIEKAQEKADKGNQVVTDGDEIKKDSNENTPKPPKEDKPTEKPQEPSKPEEPSKPTEPEKPTHSHDYKPVYKTVHHEAEYKDEWVVDKEAWDEQVPKYKWVGYYQCKKCGAQFDDGDECGYHCLTVCGSRYEAKKEQVPDGYDTVHHEAEGHYEKVVVKEAWDEQVVDYYQCSYGERK